MAVNADTMPTSNKLAQRQVVHSIFHILRSKPQPFTERKDLLESGVATECKDTVREDLQRARSFPGLLHGQDERGRSAWQYARPHAAHIPNSRERRTAQVKHHATQKDKIADAESKLQDLQRAVSRSLGEQGSLVMEHTGLEKQIAMMQQQDALTKKGQASPQPTPRKIDPNEMLEVPTADGFAMMRAGDVADTTAEEFHDIRRVFGKRVVPLLHKAKFSPSSQAGQEVAGLMASFSLLFSAKAQLNPHSAREVFLLKQPCEGPLPNTFWQGLIHYMALTGDQQQQLLKARRLYLSRQGQLLRARQSLISRLQASFSKSAGPTEVDILEKASREQELEKQLQANLEEDNSLFTQFCDEAKIQILSLWQRAIMGVHVWPRPFDALELCNYLAKEALEPASQELLSQHGQRQLRGPRTLRHAGSPAGALLEGLVRAESTDGKSWNTQGQDSRC
ncbi:hypothetical protein WJX84_004522 [Apatococcus fuscideae]|uniref:Uncharacterized protein n=1 Tax=Apatococcus fuscideae TaxID=2026836 RepID=A0AAW1TAK6_9CHLO